MVFSVIIFQTKATDIILKAQGPAQAAPPQSRNLNKAQAAKNDEFYTRSEDIDNEVNHYTPHFRGKSVFCNCDDPALSNFWRVFRGRFAHLGLERLVATHYELGGAPSYKLAYDGKREKKTALKGDGDFRSPECVALMKEADIVVTNPPFSLFREYIAQLMTHRKKFLVIGNMNAFNYKEIRPLILGGKVWMGCNDRLWFRVPPDYSGPGVIKADREGNKFINITSAWFTNLPHDRRVNEQLPLTARREGNMSAYPKYDNYDAIEVSKIRDIPRDYLYPHKMGVPISFLLNHNPEQFEIVGFDRDVLPGGGGRFRVNGREKYARLVIRRKGGQ